MNVPQEMEGFICPICMEDLNNPLLLTKHFEEFHKAETEILAPLKDLFGKAKKKILKQDDASNFSGQLILENKKHKQEIDWGPQEIGLRRSHTAYFKDIRNTRMERYSSETNKLLIRLDKLLTNLPNDPTERKAHEREVVPWMDDKDVRLCLTCAKSFNFGRRKHHCRLCGVMMCNDCSLFLSLIEARKMTSAATSQDDFALSPANENPNFTDRLVQAGVVFSKFAKSPSSGSLNTVLSVMRDPANGEQHFRVCHHCMNLLDARERLKTRQFDKPFVHNLYEKMQSQIQEANRFIDMYYKMWESLNNGESTYELRDAQTVRGKIAKIGDNIDLISKKISTLVVIDDNSPALLKQEYRLTQMVRSSAMIFLKNELLRTPPVPSKEEYEIIKQERQEKIKAKIAYERQLEEELIQRQKDIQKEKNQERSKRNNSPPPVNQVVLDQSQGWGTSRRVGENKMISTDTMNPFVEQMSNLKFYIKQAREECKFDEVATLEKNLKELQSAYFSMQHTDCNSHE